MESRDRPGPGRCHARTGRGPEPRTRCPRPVQTPRARAAEARQARTGFADARRPAQGVPSAAGRNGRMGLGRSRRRRGRPGHGGTRACGGGPAAASAAGRRRRPAVRARAVTAPAVASVGCARRRARLMPGTGAGHEGSRVSVARRRAWRSVREHPPVHAPLLAGAAVRVVTAGAGGCDAGLVIGGRGHFFDRVMTRCTGLTVAVPPPCRTPRAVCSTSVRHRRVAPAPRGAGTAGAVVKPPGRVEAPNRDVPHKARYGTLSRCVTGGQAGALRDER